jgi:hypothetical protein
MVFSLALSVYPVSGSLDKQKVEDAIFCPSAEMMSSLLCAEFVRQSWRLVSNCRTGSLYPVPSSLDKKKAEKDAIFCSSAESVCTLSSLGQVRIGRSTVDAVFCISAKMVHLFYVPSSLDKRAEEDVIFSLSTEMVCTLSSLGRVLKLS